MPEGEVDLLMCGRHEEAIERIDGWLKAQNGTLKEVRNEVGSIRRLLTGTLVSLVLLLGGILADVGVRLWLVK